jgi:hypothetical protein
MLSRTLVQLIEAHSEEIASRLIAAIRDHPDMQNLAKRPDWELRDWCRTILENISYLLSVSANGRVSQRFEALGYTLFEEGIPLHESVLNCRLLKEKILGSVHEQSSPMTSVQLYAEKELEQMIGSFFDACVYRIVRGYEFARRSAARLSS